MKISNEKLKKENLWKYIIANLELQIVIQCLINISQFL